MSFERIEPSGQVRAVRLEPRVELCQRLGAEPVHATLGVAPDVDEAGVAEHLEMSGDTGLVHPDLFDEVADRALGVADRVEDPSPGGVGDHVEDGERSGHGLSI